jgi:hypothetical protein
MTNLTVVNIDQHVKFINEREGDTLPKVYVLEVLDQIKGYADTDEKSRLSQVIEFSKTLRIKLGLYWMYTKEDAERWVKQYFK